MREAVAAAPAEGLQPGLPSLLPQGGQHFGVLLKETRPPGACQEGWAPRRWALWDVTLPAAHTQVLVSIPRCRRKVSSAMAVMGVPQVNMSTSES